MDVSADDFRHALSRFASGVTVVTARKPDGTPVGVTVSAFSSLSLDPPLILICLDRATANLDAYTEGPAFAVNILAAGQETVSDAFAFPGPVPPFARVAHTDGDLGPPLISGALAHLECRRHALIAGGDHDIVVGRVARASCTEAEPLVYARGAYRRLAPA